MAGRAGAKGRSRSGGNSGEQLAGVFVLRVIAATFGGTMLDQALDAAALVHMVALLENVQRHARSSSTPRALLDAALLRLAMSEKFADVAALLTTVGPPRDALSSSDTMDSFWTDSR